MEALGMRKWSSSTSSTALLLAVANLLIPAAVLIFAAGFFPYKPFVPGLAV
jgi:ethanolaminephosphotransferase